MVNGGEIEKALFLSRLPERDSDHDVLFRGVQRLYFGAEFCPWNMPSPHACMQALHLARSRGLAFTLATPVLIESWLPRLAKLLHIIAAELTVADEILISDWGALEHIRKILPAATVIVGRTLSGQKRGPRILDLELTSEQYDYFQRGSWYSAAAVTLLTEQGIRRVELDNLLQGVAPLPKNLDGSLHYPWIMVASSRNCPFRQDNAATGCDVSCGEAFSLTTAQTRIPLLQAGNTQFVEHRKLPQNLADRGISRLVEHRVIPR
ncbi:MAG: hypothetical protein RQ724_11135 [Desulfuromonadales bacterium]|nr:hypothetical protein [Desulfuromonadales bacterium]